MRTMLAERVQTMNPVQGGPASREPRQHLVVDFEVRESSIARGDRHAPLEEEADGVGREVGRLDVEVFDERFDRVGQDCRADLIVREKHVGEMRCAPSDFADREFAQRELPHLIPSRSRRQATSSSRRLGRSGANRIFGTRIDKGGREQARPALNLDVTQAQERHERVSDPSASFSRQRLPVPVDKEQEDLQPEGHDVGRDGRIRERVEEDRQRVFELRDGQV